MTGGLQRAHLAKMIVNYASEILGRTGDQKKACIFDDIEKQNTELQ
jgi:hypothetical protein